MKVTEPRSSHKYFPMLVGRGYRHQVVKLGGSCLLQVTQSIVMAKGLSVELDCLVNEGDIMLGDRGQVAVQ